MGNYRVKINENYCQMLRSGYGQLIGRRLRYEMKQKGYVKKLKFLFLTWPSSHSLL